MGLIFAGVLRGDGETYKSFEIGAQKPQISPLRYGPVEMIILWEDESSRFQASAAKL